MAGKIIAVYGSAHVLPGSAEYEAARRVGGALAAAGYAVMTGGYGGIMAGASQGAAEQGGHVIGVTVNGVKLESERIVNPWVVEEIPTNSMRERLHILVDRADGYVVMPGGVGTLQELAEAWQMQRLAEVPRPLVVFGGFWRPFIEELQRSAYVPREHAGLVRLAEHAQDVVAALSSNGRG